jgi:pyruvate/2-oxoglutarate dehydrogenase complex dihydrolipoamide dehydrogenase (E3) component
MLECNYLIVGAGQSGLILAESLAKSGKSVILVDQGEIGGSYLFSSEVPKYFLSQKARDFAIALKQFKDYRDTFSILLKHRQKINLQIVEYINNTKEAIEKKLKNLPTLKILRGTAEFTSKKLVEINSETERHLIGFDKAILTVGKGTMVMPKIKGIEDVDFLYQHNIFQFEKIPSKLAIIGFTQKNLEIANIYANLGVRVTIFDKKDSSKVLTSMDSTALNFTIKELSNKQVEFYFKTEIITVKTKDKNLILHSSNKQEFIFSNVYIEVEENFETKSMNLDKVDIQGSLNGIIVDNAGRTKQKHIYAFGQAGAQTVERNKYTNIYNFIIQETNEKSRKSTPLNILSTLSEKSKNIPEIKTNCTQIALDNLVVTIGLTESESIDKFGTQIKSDFIESKTLSGFVKLVYREESDQILGVCMAGEFADKFKTAILEKLQTKCGYQEILGLITLHIGL